MSELMLPKKPSVFSLIDKLLIEKNNFLINVTSKPLSTDKITSFPEISSSQPIHHASITSLKRNILIVGEIDKERNLIVNSFTLENYHLLIATTPEEALNFLSEHPIDIIINNFQESFLFFEFVKKIKPQSAFSHIPLLIASSIQERVNKGLLLGAEDFFDPTLDPFLVHLRIKIWLETKSYQNFQVENLIEIRARLSLLKEAVECIDDGFAIFDRYDRLVLCNQSFQNIYQLEDTDIQQNVDYQKLLEINYQRGIYLLNGRRSLKNPQPLDHKYFTWLSKRLKFHLSPFKAYIDTLSNGHHIQIIEKKMPKGGTIAIYKNVTEQLQYESEIQYLATHDILTGLANRVLFKKALEDNLSHSQKNPFKIAVIYIDLDGFKSINDTFGHAYGDHLLTEVSKRLHKCLRKSDLVARLGGDEFSLLIKKVKNLSTLENLIHRLQENICMPIKYNGKTMKVSASIGAYYGSTQGLTPTSLMLAVDKAMYEAKRSGPNNYRFV